MFSADIPAEVEALVAHWSPKRKHAAKASRAETLAQSGGPVTIAAILSDVGGRWAAELGNPAALRRSALKTVERAAGIGHHDVDDGARLGLGSAHVAGLAVFRGWRLVRGAVSHADIWALAQACATHHRKRAGPRLFEHEVLAAGIVQSREGATVTGRSSSNGFAQIARTAA